MRRAALFRTFERIFRHIFLICNCVKYIIIKFTCVIWSPASVPRSTVCLCVWMKFFFFFFTTLISITLYYGSRDGLFFMVARVHCWWNIPKKITFRFPFPITLDIIIILLLCARNVRAWRRNRTIRWKRKKKKKNLKL